MKKVQLILALIALMAITSTGYAVNNYSDDFDGPDFETPGIWTTWGSPYFDGSGHFIENEMTMDDTPPWTVDVYQGDGMYRTIGAGDFVMHVAWSTFDLDATADMSWKAYQLTISDDGVEGEGQARSGDDRFTIVMSTWFNTDTTWGPLGDRPGIYVDAFNNSSELEEHYGYDIAYELGEPIDLTDLDVTLTWSDTARTFTLDWSANSGAISDIWTSSGMFDASTEYREERIHADGGWWNSETEQYEPGEWAPTFALDSYSLVPEPVTIALLGLGGLALLRRRIR